jgi:hypothetical protein
VPKSRRKTMDTENEVLATFFDSDAKYIVPRFQRDYNWNGDHVKEFWEDLHKHYVDWKKDRVPYYFGSFMLVNEDESDPRFLVVDGQQRLTTCMLFFIALRDYFLEVGETDDVNELNEIIHIDDGKKTSRLHLNRYNDPYFQRQLIPQNPISQKKIDIARDVKLKDKQILNTYKEFEKIIIDSDNVNFLGVPTEEKNAILRDIYDHLQRNFIVVTNIFATKHRAYRIFETINHKGLGLNENDLVKNYLLELIDDTNTIEESQEVIDADTKWGDITNILEQISIKEDTLLRSHLTAYVGKTPKKKIYDTVVGRVTDKSTAKNFLNEIEASAKYLSRLKKPELSEWHNSQVIVDNLNGYAALSDGAMYPIFLVAKSKLDNKNTEKLIELIVKLHFRAKTVCGVSFTNIEALVVHICKKFRESSSYTIPDIVEDMKNWGSFPDDEVFGVNFKNLTLSSSPKAKYVLTELEFDMNGGRSMASKIIPNDITIEHIMPKNIDDWMADIKKETELSKPAEINDYHQRNLFRLGNLTLLAPRPNSIIQNDPYSKKLNGTGEYTGYINDEMKLSSRLSQYPTKWTEQEIKNRQDGFLIQAQRIWKIE